MWGGGGRERGRGVRWPNNSTMLWCMWVKVLFFLVYACCLCVKHQNGERVLNGGVVWAATPHDVPRSRADISGRAMRTPSLIGSGGGSETVNLSGRSDTSSQCWQSVRCHTSRLCPPPSRNSLSSSPPPFTSRWIFSRSPTLKTLLTATVRASKWRKCVRRVCDVVFRAAGYAGQTTLVSQCEQTAKKE